MYGIDRRSRSRRVLGLTLGLALLLLFAGAPGAAAQSVTGRDEVEAPRPGPPPPPPPSSPSARYWHSLTSNGSSFAGGSTCTPGQSPLYVFGGVDEEYQGLNDLWIYCAGGGWSLAPTGRSKPGGRWHVAWACGGEGCVAVGGVPVGRETWVYSELEGGWSQLNCRKAPCPSARGLATLEWDPSRQYYVLFGGRSGYESLGDTHTLQLGKWTARSPSSRPSPRSWAAAAFVPSHAGRAIDRVVLFGGLDERSSSVRALCDMHAWTGTKWAPITYETGGPCLYGHDLAWVGDVEGLGPGLMVTGGYIDDGGCGTPNETSWYFLFTSSTSGYWRVGSPLTCDVTPIPPGARMAVNGPSQKKVFFGGFDAEVYPQTVPVDTLAVCE